SYLSAPLRHLPSFPTRRSSDLSILAALDVLVHCPSAPEPFGRVLAEAMAAGRPVVAARCGGIPEVVADTVTGYLVDSDDVGAFRSEEHTSELQSLAYLVCRLLL